MVLRLKSLIAIVASAAFCIMGWSCAAQAQMTMMCPVYSGAGAGLAPLGSTVDIAPAAWLNFDGLHGVDLLYAGVDDFGLRRTYLYTRTADGSYALTAGHNLPDVDNAFIAAADFNSDGYADLFFAGETGSGPITKIYLNESDGGSGRRFTDTGTVLPDVLYGAQGGAWGDCDGDGDLDLLTSGSGETRVYRNDAGVFVALASGLPMRAGAVAWADYDGDHDLDAIMNLENAISTDIYIYRNLGGCTFEDASTGVFAALSASRLLAGDWEGDGDIDIFYDGVPPGWATPEAHIYLNDGSGAFTQLTSGASQWRGWADLDGDGDLDLYGNASIRLNDYPELVDFNASWPVTGQAHFNFMTWADHDADGDLDYMYMAMDGAFGWPTTDVVNAAPAVWGWIDSGAPDYTPIEGVSMSGGALGTETTNEYGWFGFTELAGNMSYSITPSLAGYMFTPSSAAGMLHLYAPLEFTGVRVFAIEGTVTLNGLPAEGVGISGGSLGTQTTNASGAYQFAGVPENTEYTLTPGKAGLTFFPSSSSGTLTADASHSFTADACPDDAQKVVPGTCGCGTADTDSDGDATADCLDLCPGNAPKTAPGVCGCSTADMDSDGDSTADCVDLCPNDAAKNAPGVCGCGAAEISLDTDLDGLWNCVDTDDDSDLISDVQEIEDGTDPLDSGSSRPVLSARLCAEWNGFLGMWNVMEHNNVSQSEVAVETAAYGGAGTAGRPYSFGLPAAAQRDVLVHELDQWRSDDFGEVCSTVSSGSGAGALDGRMVYYKPAAPGSGEAFEFAFAMPLSNGAAGAQWVPLNTFQPSLDRADSENLVVNWVQVRNTESTPQTGTLAFYNESGALSAAQTVYLAAHERRDYPGHAAGAGRVGAAAWIPDSRSARFQVRNVRYYYDNRGTENSFDGATAIDALKPSGQALAAPLRAEGGSAILEIINALGRSQNISVAIYGGGRELYKETFTVPAHGSQHFIADGMLTAFPGLAVVRGEHAQGVAAVAVHYGRTASHGIRYVYNEALHQPLGSSLQGAYNTFLGQGCMLLLGNTGTAGVTAAVSALRFDGTPVVTGEQLWVPAKSTVLYDFCMPERSDTYGTVRIAADQQGALVASLLRIGVNGQYMFSVGLRQ